MKTVSFPGNVYSVREIKKREIIVTYSYKKLDYMILWNGLDQVNAEDHQPKEKLMVRQKKEEDPDRDIEIDD